MRFVAILVAGFWAACTSTRGDEERAKQTRVLPPADTIRLQDTTYTRIGNAFGVVTLTGSYARGDTVKLYNEDGSLWYQLAFYDNDWASGLPSEFRPRAFHPDAVILAFDVVEDLGPAYRVIVNKETGLRKRIPKSSFLKFQTWEEYVLGSFAVGFDTIANPMRRTPNGEREANPRSGDHPFRPVSIQGEWLQIKWGREGAESHAWIRWREVNRLLIYVFHFA